MIAESLTQIAGQFNARAEAQGWTARCDPDHRFEKRELADFKDLWHAAAAGRTMPLRTEMSPRVLKPWLVNVSIYERVSVPAGRRYRVRLLGSAYHQTFGDMTGQFLDAALPAAAVPLWEHVLDTLIAAPAPLRFVTRSEITGKDFLVSEYCSGPLADERGEPAYVIGVGYYHAGNWDNTIRALGSAAV